MLKKHTVQEQSIEDYAETIQQLSQTSRKLAEDQHPERFVITLFSDIVIWLFLISLLNPVQWTNHGAPGSGR